MLVLRLFFLVLLAAVATGASAQTFSGRLEASDDTLTSGEFVDEYTVAVAEGERVAAVVTSDAFDTYVILVASSGAQVEDDDCTEGETSRSCGALVADADGEIRVLVTSYAVGETGAYEVEIAVDGEVRPESTAESGGGTDGRVR